jgi:DNA-binding protein HU-beta
VNKAELIEHIAIQVDIPKALASRVIDSMLDAVKTTLKYDGTLSLSGFGTFYVNERVARTGRNPSTGVALKIPAAKVPKFRPGKALKDALN